jgi:diguanylate cyclase (GGDEF)-like protein
MSTDRERRRVLVAARPAEEEALRPLFSADALAGWEPVGADSFHRARFTLQHTACDVLLIDEGLYCAEGPEGLAWLARQQDVPTVFLGGSEAEVCAQAYERGAAICLPRRTTLDHPPLLAAALRRAAGGAEQARGQRRTREALAQCRRQVDRLVGLLWRTVPMDTQTQWCSQRHILERLQEEVARSGRHGHPLTVAVGEVQAPAEDRAHPDAGRWVAQRLGRIKRRCDVAGQYGPHGFLLLMVHTPGRGGAACCRRLQRALEEPAAPNVGPRGPVRACFGLASHGAQAATPQALLRTAEERLEAARSGTGDRVVAD